jgi:2-hydroxychromene-2-carboxylate isomerase
MRALCAASAQSVLTWIKRDPGAAMREPMHHAPIDFYFDFISPYGYFASLQIEQLAAKHGRSLRWHSMLLGVSVLKVMGLKPLLETPLKGDYVRRDMPRQARRLGLALARRPRGTTENR